MTLFNLPVDDGRLWSDLMALAAITEPDQPYTRRSFTPRFLDGRTWLAQRFQDAGLSVRIDAAGNLIGRRAGRCADAPAIFVGSHSDTVPGGGRFDGVAGVIAALEVARSLAERGIVFDHPFEVVHFLAEEPSAYGLSCVGSRGMAGALGPDELALPGPDGEPLGDALKRVGGDPDQLAQAQRADVGAYLELHIEQGTVLERSLLDIGVVTAIVGITRIEIVFGGEAAHAGTAGMSVRRDAAVAAAATVLAVRDFARALLARDEGYIVATTGVLTVAPGASNVVPGSARLIVDLRAETREQQQEALRLLRRRVEEISRESNVAIEKYAILSYNDPTACDPRLRGLLAESAVALGCAATTMASGAGHDAAFVARIAPSAMIFIPCRAGRSHCPEEWSEPSEIAAGAAVLFEAVRRLDQNPRTA